MTHYKEVRRQLAIANAKQPSTLTKIPPEQWPAQLYDVKRIELWRSNKFLVQVFAEVGALRVSVCRVTLGTNGRLEDGISWDDLQQIKREIGRGELWAVECYPADCDLVNVANMRHLWILPEPPAFGWRRESNNQGNLYRCAACSSPIGIDDGKLCQACYQRGAR